MISHQSSGERSEGTWESSKNWCLKLNQLNHLNQCSAPGLSTIYYLSGSLLLMSKATFIPSTKPNLDLSRNRTPLTSVINTLLYSTHSCIISTCINRPNTLWSTLFANPYSYISSIPKDIFVTACQSPLEICLTMYDKWCPISCPRLGNVSSQNEYSISFKTCGRYAVKHAQTPKPSPI